MNNNNTNDGAGSLACKIADRAAELFNKAIGDPARNVFRHTLWGVEYASVELSEREFADIVPDGALDLMWENIQEAVEYAIRNDCFLTPDHFYVEEGVMHIRAYRVWSLAVHKEALAKVEAGNKEYVRLYEKWVDSLSRD